MRFSLLLAFIIGIFAAHAAAQTAAPDALLVASSGEHLWIVRETVTDRGEYRADLLHHALDMGGPHATATVPLYNAPEGIAAFGDRVWIVSPPRPRTVNTAPSGRSVHTLRVRKRAEIELYATEPEGRFGVLDMLPGEGELVGFTATAQGPIALIRLAEREVVDERDVLDEGHADEGSIEDEAAAAEDQPLPGTRYRLLQLRGDRWSPLPLPDSVDYAVGDYAAIAIDGPDRSRLNVLTSDPNDPSRVILHRRLGGVWSTEPAAIDLDLRTLRTLTHVRGRLAAILNEPRAADVEIAFVRPDAVLRLARLETPPPTQRWAIIGMDDGFRMIELSVDDDARLIMRTIHWLTGEAGAADDVTRPPLPAGRLWHLTIMLTIAVLAVLLVLLVRPSAAGAATGGAMGRAGAAATALPKGVVIFPAIPRLIAMLIDLAPGGILAVLILRVPVIELLRLPILTHSIEHAAPYLVMISIMFVHVTLSEMAKSTTLGKAIMGGRVTNLDGSPPNVKQVFVRNVLKLLILMVPPLAIFALLSRQLQGFNDLLARTVVVGDAVEEEKEPEEED